MIRSMLSLLCAVSFLLAPVAMATGSGSSSMTIEDLKDKCKELQANDQLKPFKAVVSCKQSTTEWRPVEGQSSSIEVKNTGSIGAAFTLKGFQVPFKSESLELPSQEVGCTVLEQIKLTVPAVDLELSCEALDAVTSIKDLCKPAIDGRVEADPSIVQEEATGIKFDSCSGSKGQSQSK